MNDVIASWFPMAFLVQIPAILGLYMTLQQSKNKSPFVLLKLVSMKVEYL